MPLVAEIMARLVLLATLSLPLTTQQASTQPTGRYAVVIVLDGARPDYFKLTPMPNLRALQARGVTYSQAIAGQELANTPPSHATIGTGVLPRQHGVEGFLWEDPHTHLMTDPTETGAVESEELERVISGSHVPTLAGEVKAAYPGAHVASVAAHKCYASDAMGTADSDYILCSLIYHGRWVAQAVGNHLPPPGALNNPQWDVPIPPRTSGFGAAVQQWRVGAENAWTVRYALWAFHRVHYPRVLMMNLSETDVLGHFALNDSVIRYLMREFDTLLGSIVNSYRQAGLLDRTDFVITADHGMSRVKSFLPYSLLNRSVALAGTSPVYIEHDTAAAIGLVDDSKAQAVARNVFRLGGTAVDATYYKVEDHGQWQYRLAALQRGRPPGLEHAYAKLASTMASAAGPDVFVVFGPNISTRHTVAYGYVWKAGHLGPQWGDQHIPLVLSGPGLKQGVNSTYPARLVDIAPTIEHLLGTRTGPVDGIVLNDALTQQSAAGTRAQRLRGSTFDPIVAALQHRAGYR
jgi:predicted AlkP superfamily pyrophosphatase or phosphodiesterase